MIFPITNFLSSGVKPPINATNIIVISVVIILQQNRRIFSSISETNSNAGIMQIISKQRHLKTVLIRNCFTGNLVIGFSIITRSTRATIENITIDSCDNSGLPPNNNISHATGKFKIFTDPTTNWYFFIFPVANIK